MQALLSYNNVHLYLKFRDNPFKLFTRDILYFWIIKATLDSGGGKFVMQPGEEESSFCHCPVEVIPGKLGIAEACLWGPS